MGGEGCCVLAPDWSTSVAVEEGLQIHKGVVAELLDTVAKHRFVQKISVLSE